MGGDKSKKLKMSEKEKGVAVEEESNPQLDDELIVSVEKLQEIQEELEKINEEASDKVLEVEQKYNEIRKPVYNKRNEIIKSIPEFWFTSFMSHPSLGMLLTEEDQKIFKYLGSLEVEDSKDLKSGYSIIFNFEPNPYFENTRLTKAFSFLDEGTAVITATPINWKDGKSIVLNGVENEKKGKKRPLAEESFFTWFSSHEKEMTEDVHDEIAEIIKEDLWPNPLSYFTADPDEEDSDAGEADEEDKEGDGSEEDGDEDDEDDNDEEDEDADN